MLVYLVQFESHRMPPTVGSMAGPLLLIVGGACAGALLIPVLGFMVSRWKASAVSWRMRRRQRRSAVNAEERARAMMTELCPYGWQAQITLFDGPSGRGDEERVPDAVAVDWAELAPDTGQPAVLRRVWGPTIAEALEAMVADRRTDETLEQIELQASADGMLWPD